MRSKLIVMTAVALAIGGCHRPDADHPKTDYTTSLLSRMSPGEIEAATVPPAPAARGPIPPNANAADPATNASLAFSNGSNAKTAPTPDSSPDGEHAAVMAEEAAAQAPDTATADEAKRKIYAEYAARSFAAPNANGATAKGSSANGGSVNRSSASSTSTDGSNSTGSTSNSSGTNGSGKEPVAAQSNGATSSEESAARPAS